MNKRNTEHGNEKERELRERKEKEGPYKYFRPTCTDHENRPKSTTFLYQGGDEDIAFLWNL